MLYSSITDSNDDGTKLSLDNTDLRLVQPCFLRISESVGALDGERNDFNGGASLYLLLAQRPGGLFDSEWPCFKKLTDVEDTIQTFYCVWRRTSTWCTRHSSPKQCVPVKLR
eukprot:scaffold39659_cov52-Attheya_sp.AAC.2